MSEQNTNRRAKVYVPNKSFHDFSAAEQFGDLIYVTEGVISRLNINQLEAAAATAMREAAPGDYIVISSLPVLTSIMTGIMANRFGRANFLLYRHGGYIARSVEF